MKRAYLTAKEVEEKLTALRTLRGYETVTEIKINEEIIKEAQEKIIAKGKNPYYPVEQHLKDMDLIADLTKLKMKYKER